jgi:hypothetical protein
MKYLLLAALLPACATTARHVASPKILLECSHWDSEDQDEENTYVSKVLQFRADANGTSVDVGRQNANSQDGNFHPLSEIRLGRSTRNGNELVFASAGKEGRFLVHFGVSAGKIRRYFDENYPGSLSDHAGVGYFEDKPTEPWFCQEY